MGKQEIFVFACFCIRGTILFIWGGGRVRGEGRWVSSKILMLCIRMLFGVLNHGTVYYLKERRGKEEKRKEEGRKERSEGGRERKSKLL